MDTTTATRTHREPWNKGKLIGQKAPFKLKDIWALPRTSGESPSIRPPGSMRFSSLARQSKSVAGNS